MIILFIDDVNVNTFVNPDNNCWKIQSVASYRGKKCTIKLDSIPIEKKEFPAFFCDGSTINQDFYYTWSMYGDVQISPIHIQEIAKVTCVTMLLSLM